MSAQYASYIVIGSGPSGVAASSALLDLGSSVTLVDIGADLSSKRRHRMEELSKKSPTQWSTEDRADLVQGLDIKGERIPPKRLFGEDFMYANDGPLRPHFNQWSSRGLGGFSRIWGATLKQFSCRDLVKWPIGEEHLRDHYKSVEQLLGQHGASQSGQATGLLDRWRKSADSLLSLGAEVGPASLAISSDCNRCGLCLTGCPYNHIFSSDVVVRRFQARDGFLYRSGLTVRHVRENGNQVEVIAADEKGNQERLTAERVFVAAGPLATARLMLSSFGDASDSLTLRDSQYFLLPFASFLAPKVEQAHALSQIFVEIKDSGSSVHVQLYGQNDMYGEVIAAMFGSAKPLVWPLARRLGRHFLLAQGYLPSDESGSADLSILCDALQITPRLSTRTLPMLRRVWQRLAKVGRLAGLHALPSLAQQAEIGRGYHSGGTLPMTKQPRGWQTDTVGRARGLARVHVVDASVWTDIPSGPVTLTAMANAHRIASEFFKIERT